MCQTNLINVKQGCTIFIYGIVRLSFSHTVFIDEFDKMQIPLSVKTVCYTLFT